MDDCFTVFAFDHNVRCVTDWRVKGSLFCSFCFMGELKGIIDTMDRNGTSLYSAVVESYEALRVQVPDGREGNLILVTDGEAMDPPERFEEARRVICQPDIAMRMLLLHIDPQGCHFEFSPPPKTLGMAANGNTVDHFAYLEVPLPGSVDSTHATGRYIFEGFGAALSLVKGLPTSATSSDVKETR